jgi:hypothetical protein
MVATFVVVSPVLDIGRRVGNLSGFRILFISKARCSLCEDAERTIEWAARLSGAGIDRHNLEDDPSLAQYAERVPVVLGPSGAVLAEGRVTLSRLLVALLRERRR